MLRLIASNKIPVDEAPHQTAEGTRLQLQSSSGRTHAVVVSTIMEACEVFRAGLIADGTVTDVSHDALFHDEVPER